MRDGCELAADVHLPDGLTGPVPAMVTGTPYDKSFDGNREYRDAGIASVVFDVRGRGKSEGIWHPFEKDGEDGHDVVEWVARQPWCDGEVGISGLSYGGWIVWATIAERPPHLRAAISTSAAGRWQEELPYTYGCFWLYFAYWFARVRRRVVEHGRDIRPILATLPVGDIGKELNVSGPGWDELMEHDSLDALWAGRRWDGAYDFDVPCLHVTGWHDREDIQGAFHHYEQMLDHSPARDSQWLIVGPWSHFSCRYPSDEYDGVPSPGGAIDMSSLHSRFLRRFLTGEENGFEEMPHVMLYDPGAARWVAGKAWQEDTTHEWLYLAADGVLSSDPPAPGADEYLYDPGRPNGLTFDVNAGLWEPPLDLAELVDQDGVLSWATQTLDHDVTIHGWSALDLFATTDGEDTEWHVKLSDISPDGEPRCVAWGCLRASHNASNSCPQPVHQTWRNGMRSS
jgi:hypothetical protein